MIDKELLKILVDAVEQTEYCNQEHFDRAIYHLKKSMEVVK